MVCAVDFCHRDLKQEKLLLNEHSNLNFLDFGRSDLPEQLRWDAGDRGAGGVLMDAGGRCAGGVEMERLERKLQKQMELVRMQTEIDSPLGCGDNANIPIGLFATPRFLSKIFDSYPGVQTGRVLSSGIITGLLQSFFPSTSGTAIWQASSISSTTIQGKKDWLKRIRSRVQKLKMLQKNGSFTAPVTEKM
nr:CBL-interacting serine/threonine-protein kinase 5-like isoform X3 [Ipomoea batatas]